MEDNDGSLLLLLLLAAPAGFEGIVGNIDGAFPLLLDAALFAVLFVFLGIVGNIDGALLLPPAVPAFEGIVGNMEGVPVEAGEEEEEEA